MPCLKVLCPSALSISSVVSDVRLSRVFLGRFGGPMITELASWLLETVGVGRLLPLPG